MGSITVFNDTDLPINTSISAGVNYDWCNRLWPKTYYRHTSRINPIGVFTLNARLWFGAESEYQLSAAEIGLFVGGVLLGVVGLVLTGGGATPAIITAVGAGVGGLAIGGMTIAAKDFANTPFTLPEIHSIRNPKFIAEYKGSRPAITVDKKEGGDRRRNPTVTISGNPEIKLRPLTDAEFKILMSDGAFREHQATRDLEAPITKAEATVLDLARDGVLNFPLRITPSLGGDACWEVKGDQIGPDSRMQLWSREAEESKWEIVPISQQPNSNTFWVYNRKLKAYASTAGDPQKTHFVALNSPQTGQSSFHIVRSMGRYVFVPTEDDANAVVHEDGNLGNSTTLIRAPIASSHPARARWSIEAPIVKSYATRAQLEADGVIERDLLIFSYLGGDTCWEVENDGSHATVNGPMQLWSRDTEEVGWRIRPISEDPQSTGFRIYNEALKKFVGVEKFSDGWRLVASLTVGSEHNWFYVVKSLGKYVFIYNRQDTLAVALNDNNYDNGAKLRLLPIGDHPNRARWHFEALSRGDSSDWRLWICGCATPVRAQVASDSFKAHCDVCGQAFRQPASG